jgi:glycosyltransferase involved in cell wall biosynthesis
MLFPSGDSDALAVALERFGSLADDRLAGMGAAGRKWVEANFSADIYRRRLLDLYRSILGDTP